jgi:hypothetical protein
MKKIVFTFLLAVVSNNSYAAWTNFGTSVSREGNVIAYVNQSTIKRNGSKTKMWVLYDSRLPRKFGKLTYMSSMGQDEYDCQTAQSRNLAVLLYSKNLGHGDVVSSSSTPSSNWDPAPPDSMAGHLLHYACAMK